MTAGFLSVEEQVKKFNISSKLFKLRYLCKYHLQLCAVLSQLTKHREALHHGMLASFYCQELIRNSHILCQGYIAKLQAPPPDPKASSLLQPKGLASSYSAQFKQEADAAGGSIPALPYYVEENENFLNLLISNCEPILREISAQVDQFNQKNKIADGF